MSREKFYYVAELVGVVEGCAGLLVARTLADGLGVPLERIGGIPLAGGNTGLLVLWATVSSEAEADRKAAQILPHLEARGPMLLPPAGLPTLHLYVLGSWELIASSLAGGVQ